MARLRGRARRGERLRSGIPHGHWKTTTFVAGLRLTGMMAPFVLDGPMNRSAFLAYVTQVLAPELKPGDVVGRELRPKGQPEPVRMHDFPLPELGRAAPYGVYDIGDNKGWVSVGVDHDTADFAVAAIRRWWQLMGQARYPKARHLVITADGGGSNGSRLRLWKLKLQSLADELGLTITICHLPPGTSKWNKIEHRLFAFITQNWRGKPLMSHQVIVELIAATTTNTGLTVRAGSTATPTRQGHQGLRSGNGHHQPSARRLPRRMELHHQAPTAHRLTRLFGLRPLR